MRLQGKDGSRFPSQDRFEQREKVIGGLAWPLVERSNSRTVELHRQALQYSWTSQMRGRVCVYANSASQLELVGSDRVITFSRLGRFTPCIILSYAALGSIEQLS